MTSIRSRPAAKSPPNNPSHSAAPQQPDPSKSFWPRDTKRSRSDGNPQPRARSTTAAVLVPLSVLVCIVGGLLLFFGGNYNLIDRNPILTPSDGGNVQR